MEPRKMVYNAANGHVVRIGDRAMLLHVPTTALFELDALGDAVISLAERESEFDAEYLHSAVTPRFARGDVADFVARLTDLEILQVRGSDRAVNPGRVKVETYPLS